MSTTTMTGSDQEQAVVRAAKLFAHPIRVHVIHELLANGKASPSELADRLESPLGNVAYHVRQLHEAGLVKAAGQRRRRGAIEHYYAANGQASDAVKALRAATGELLAATGTEATR